MIEPGNFVEALVGDDSPLLARIKRQVVGRVGVVLKAWEPVNGHPTFWMQCTVKFPAVGRKKEVVFDFMQEWVTKVAADASDSERQSDAK